MSASKGYVAPTPAQLREKRYAPAEIRRLLTPPAPVDMNELKRWVDADSHEMRADLRSFMADEVFVRSYRDKLEDMRPLALKRLKKICEKPGRFVSVRDFETDPRRIFAAHEITCQCDGSLATKLTVQFNLFGGTVLKLGTERHHHILNKIDAVQEVGCFALTEVGFGNNAVKLETTATYDKAKQEFVINTPNVLAQKYWITNGANDSVWSVVFAQTFVDNKNEGVQAFLVRIRDSDHKACPGVVIEDMGRKLGQNGVDNAKLSFRNVRIPREALLNRVANVDESGKLVSKISSARGRFIAALNQLLSGRLCLSSKGVGRAKQALVIAVRFSATRLCVGESGESDTPIMQYQLQQRALLPLIARTYAVSCVGMTYVKNRFSEETTRNGTKGLGVMEPETEVLCSGIKALNTWHVERVGAVCRERCGGQGFLAANLFEEIIGDAHAIMTAEGDNSVLMMKVAKERLAFAQKAPADLAKTLASSTFPGFADLKNPEYLLWIFRRREALYIVELQGAMDRDMKAGAPLFEVWQMRQSDAIQGLAKAYLERVCLEQFIARTVSSPKLAPVLDKLVVLFALDAITMDIGWFVSHNMFPSGETAKIYETVRELCGKGSNGLADQVLNLVDAFSVPEHLLPPAARDWVMYNDVDNRGELKNVAF